MDYTSRVVLMNLEVKQRKSLSSETPENDRSRRSRVSQADVPAYSLDQALRIAEAIGENYAFKPTAPIHLAAGLSQHHRNPVNRG